MKTIWKDLGLAVLFGMVMPWLILNLYMHRTEPSEVIPQFTTAPITETPKLSVNVRQQDGTVIPMDMDNYITGVILSVDGMARS